MSGRRWTAAAGGLLGALLPAAAQACPACAGRDGPGLGVLAAIGGMIAVPYLVAAVAIRAVRKLEQKG